MDIKKIVKDIYVNDSGHNAVEILENGTWKNIGSITNGLNYPNGNWVNRRGNLYVTNSADSSAYVSEYGRKGSLKFTYSAGLIFPVAVATDRKGHVYVADSFTGISEYRRESNAVVASCPQLGGGQRGVAVDSHGNVFASYSTGLSGGALVEYSGGLAGCQVTILDSELGVPNGIALDKHANLLLCDETFRTVDVLAPPYTQISGYWARVIGLRCRLRSTETTRKHT